MTEQITFNITIDSQEMIVHYEPNYIPNFLVHFTFNSPHNPCRRIPVSDAGYRSHFVYKEELIGVTDIETYIYETGYAMAAARANTNFQEIIDENNEQLLLF